MDWSALGWLFSTPGGVGAYYAQQLAWGLVLGAVALTVTFVYRRR